MRTTFNLKAFRALILFFIAIATAEAQVSPAWVRFSQPASFQNYTRQETSTGVDTTGNIYTAASMYDTINFRSRIMLVKYNAVGVQQWLVNYDDNDATYNGSNATRLLVDKAGNSYVCGYGIHNSTAGYDYMVIKYDNAGNQQWIQYRDGGQNREDIASTATFDASGNIVLAGYINHTGPTGDDIAVMKWSPAGTFLWEYAYNNSVVNGNDNPSAISKDAADNIFITGYSQGTNSGDMITLKLNSAGVNQWTKVIPHVTPSSNEFGYSIIADAAGNAYVTGVAGNWLTIKYSPAGAALWTNHYTANPLDTTSTLKVMLDMNNDVIVAGTASVSGVTQKDVIIFKLANSTGTPVWSNSYDVNATTNVFSDAVMNSNGNICVTGLYNGPAGYDISTMIVSNSGSVLWTAVYGNTGRADGIDVPDEIVLDKNKNIIIAGFALTRNPSTADALDIFTLKYTALVTGISENQLDHLSLSLYPNPAKELVTISANESLAGSNISVISLNGQLVKEERITAAPYSLSVKELTKGIYLVKIVTERSVLISRLVIE